MYSGTQFVDKSPEDFLVWWRTLSAADAEMVWTKAKEYGGFHEQARAIIELTDQPMRHIGLVQLERAIMFNVKQKVARLTNALAHGELPSLDSWRDLACYAMIARRLRETKTWPA